VNILKNLSLIFISILSLFFFSCAKDLHFSGISEVSLNQIMDNYLNYNYSKEEISKIIGAPPVQEKSGNLWIYRLEKERGNNTFRKTIYNKTLKLEFENNVLRSVEEVSAN